MTLLRNNRRTHLLFSAAVLLTAFLAIPAAKAESTDLPSFGGSGGLIAGQQEASIGEQVMTSIRRSAPQVQDPLVYDYLYSVIYRLVPFAPLDNRNLKLVLIDSPALNAFAVPGGVVGVNGGLFLSATTEQQFASVLAHELAHLSQRHFARRMEQQETSAPLTLAGMIAGIVLSAVTQSDIGIAAIAGTQAMAIQNMLSYSRAHEQEADRVGLDILASAGLDPKGMPEMFEIMMRQNRLQGNQMPEYLSTHPLTQSRVSDTQNRAEQYPIKTVQDSQEYHLMRSRLQVHYAKSPASAVEVFESYVNRDDAKQHDAISYGLAVAYKENKQLDKAEKILQKLLSKNPGRITFQVSLAEVYTEQKRYDDARQILKTALSRNPRNYPITWALAGLEIADGNGSAAASYLKELARQRPSGDQIWLRLAEAEGMARNIVGVHRARAEYDALRGDYRSAQRQLRQAQEKLPAGSAERQVVSERLSDIASRIQQANRS
ncbi:MAG: M48 family metallopeptidase [Gammaproteobacteria bacterium]|uniref:Putative beta-barrel assembly-enhancing protease n=1 Tax=Marinobacter litoralis TaxID=187981 RepID=A0A3M2RLP7_9GAMM|nr:M48 family metalloprotease [Marinobacter litoralis]MBR9870067.1 M48 family metallopeptidase [Gammaproteobacteria bacterium]RMJ06092.1 TPR repeat-containing protein YfgC precursor [Marinobacter litoralis]